MKTFSPIRKTSFAWLLTLGLGCLVAGFTQTAQAQEYWVGSTSGVEHDWGTAANWSPSGVPTSANYLFITNTTSLNYPLISSGIFTNGDVWLGAFNANPARLDVTGGTLFIVSYLAVGPDAGSVATLNHSSGTVTVTGGNVFFVGQSGGTGTYNLSGDAVLTSSKTLNVGYNSTSTGIFNMTGGTLFVTNSVNIGGHGAAGDGTPTAIFNMGGGTFTSTSWFSIGESGSAVGTFNLTNGTVNAATSGGTAVNLGDRDGATGTLNVSGGTFNSTGGGISVGNHWTGTGTSTGTLNVTNGVVNTGTAANGVKLGASGAASVGTVNLVGGTLLTAKVQNGPGSGTFNFNGGTLTATANNATFMQGLTAANVQAGGAIIDTTNFNITIAQALQNAGGGLTKLGSGALTLSGANTYTGPTIVQAGTLTLDATPSPTYGSLTISNGAALGLLLNNGASTVTAGSVTFNGNTALNLSYGTAATPTTALSATSVSVTGTNTINITGQSLVVGQYVLIYTGSSVPTNNFKLGTLPTGVVATLVDSGVSLDLLITASGQNLSWYGADNLGNLLTTWNINTSSNWNSGNAKYLQYSGNSYGDNVMFDDTHYSDPSAAGITLNTAVVPASVTFNNSSTPYSITGSGSIGGATSLVKNGSGSVYLATANSYTGGTAINAGTLSVASDSALGASSSVASLNGGTLQFSNNITSVHSITVVSNSTIDVPGGFAVQFAGLVSGSAALTKTGNGTLALSNNYVAGPVNVFGGTGVVVGAVSPVGDVYAGSGFGATGTLNVNSNGILSTATWLEVGRQSGTGTLNVNGGISAAKLWVGGAWFGDNGTGVLNIDTTNSIVTTSTATLAASLVVGQANGSSADGTINLTNGTVSANGEIWVAAAGGGIGTVNQVGGTVTSTRYFLIGRQGVGTAGTYNLSGGTVNAATNFGVTSVGDQSGATGVLNISGGTFNSTAGDGSGVAMSIGTHWDAGVDSVSGTVNVSGTGLLNLGTQGISLGRYNSLASGTLNLNGGTVQTRSIAQGTGTGTVNFNGGTLRATTNSTTFMQGLTSANVMTGGALIDTAGKNITIAQPLLNNGVDEDGGLTKTGNGTLLLDGVNTYTNLTTVSAGALGGSGTINGRVVVNSSAGLAPGDGIGALTINGNLTLNAGSTNVFEVDGTTPANDTVVAGAGVAYGGVLKIAATNSFTAGQQFQLFNGAGATNASNFASVQSTSSGVVFSFTNGVLTVVSAGPSGPAQLTNSFSGGVLSLSWPAGQGWRLQMQTNSLSTGLGTNWNYITDGSISSTNITVDPIKPTVFYRLTYP